MTNPITSGISREDRNGRASWTNRMHVGETGLLGPSMPNVILLAEAVMAYESDILVQLVEIASMGISKYEVHELYTSVHMDDSGQRVITHQNVTHYAELDKARKGFIMRAYGFVVTF